MRKAPLISILCCALALLTACAPTAATQVVVQPTINYVALGDSYSAGPLIAPAAKRQPVLCGRSQANYAGYLAAYLRVRSLADVACSGATTADLYASQSVRMGLPQNRGTETAPQLDSVTAKTDLVTIGLGGNDFQLFQNVLKALLGKGDISTKFRQADAIQANIEKAIDAIHERAPHARVIVVGYLRVLPENGVCPALPVTLVKIKQADAIQRKINASLATAARTKDATFIDSYALSSGHDMCSGAQAWVNGLNTDLLKAAAFHPFRAGMNAVAQQIYRQMTAKTPPKTPTDAMLKAVPRR